MTLPHEQRLGGVEGSDDAALDAFFDQGERGLADSAVDAVLGRPGELEHEQFSGQRFLRVVVVAAWGVALLAGGTVAWGHTRFAAPGAPRWTLAAGGFVCLAAAAWLSTKLREPYLPGPHVPGGDEDGELVELRAGFRDRFVVGPADMAWALVTLAPLLVLVFV